MVNFTQRLGLPRYEADELYKMALSAFQKGNLDLALENMNKVLDRLPTRAEYWAVRGLIYLQDGIDDKAAADFEEALKRYRYEMLAHYGLGMIAYKHRRWEEALAHFTNAAAADPNRAETHYYMALTLHRLRDNGAALRSMQQAQALFEKHDDRRKADAGRWIREFERLMKKTALETGE